VLAVVLITTVIVYAATGGDPAADEAAPAPAAPATTGTPAAATTEAPSSAPSPGPTGTASPSPSADPCVVGVWLEERHDENLLLLVIGVVPFRGGGTFQRYSVTGRVTVDYGSGVRMTGVKGADTYEFVFSGIVVYSYHVQDGQVHYDNPRADGTETLYRNGKLYYTAPLAARPAPPRNLNCGSVAMSLTTADLTIEARRTSSR
jgi:hypothetical protein